ncbi:hypothetical protein [Lunatibacter salilacus]|uniref:hypothetical protein n=1 Tax=Lunatibacter salilacus TaxID=2483804 RepID=UPI00131E5831|nr:hypothetical protein [Lunatibacter salilacus]
MKKILLSVTIYFLTLSAYSQQTFIGIQNSPRKGMIHAAMNPAELNHLSRKVEFNLFAVGTAASNNLLSIQDVRNEGDLYDLALDRMEGPVNVRVESQVLGPSFGFHVNKWSFGFISQVFAKGDVINLDADLGQALNSGDYNNGNYEVTINSTSNQRVNAAGWAEFGFMAGREIWSKENHLLSAGSSFKFLIPGAFLNVGMNNLQGDIITNQDESRLSNARGSLHLSYPQNFENWDEGTMLNKFSLKNISGFAVDLGLSHQWKKNGVAKLSSGLSLRNLGGMNLSSGQVTNTYEMDIPEEEHFRLDLLDGDFDEIEDQLISSGYFTKNSPVGNTRVSLPTIISGYTDIRISKIFQVSLFGQHRLSNQESNTQLGMQNVFAVTPRLTLGIFEIYSPWANYEISGITGGAGIRLGGFFVGSQSVLTGLFSDSQQADIHLGLSLGFGTRKNKPKKSSVLNELSGIE